MSIMDIFFFSVSLVQLSLARAAFLVDVEEGFLTVFLSWDSVAVHGACSSSIKQKRIYYRVTGSLQILEDGQRTRLGCHRAKVSCQGKRLITPRGCCSRKSTVAATCYLTFTKSQPEPQSLCYGSCRWTPWPCFPEGASGLTEFTLFFQVSRGESTWLRQSHARDTWNGSFGVLLGKSIIRNVENYHHGETGWQPQMREACCIIPQTSCL